MQKELFSYPVFQIYGKKEYPMVISVYLGAIKKNSLESLHISVHLSPSVQKFLQPNRPR